MSRVIRGKAFHLRSLLDYEIVESGSGDGLLLIVKVTCHNLTLNCHNTTRNCHNLTRNCQALRRVHLLQVRVDSTAERWLLPSVYLAAHDPGLRGSSAGLQRHQRLVGQGDQSRH